ncbi:CAP domain-containing protein [Allokutzneria oryzae]|uniref:CAP domain-containing protein n=1 Tax=Allokutzneria oryzae TaxID=1378989 RepID=A0ABV6A4H0_9PSEU
MGDQGSTLLADKAPTSAISVPEDPPSSTGSTQQPTSEAAPTTTATTSPESSTTAPPTTTTSNRTSEPEQPPAPERPTTTPARRSTPQPPPAPSGPAAKVTELVNQARSEAGCSALRIDERLANAAQRHSVDMAERNYFSHTSPDGASFVDRARAAGYASPGGENIAKGQRSAEQVMESWMQSSGHRANILNCQFTSLGMGLDTRGWVWTQVFGR